jgi:predicted O-methyltransferase YrrM
MFARLKTKVKDRIRGFLYRVVHHAATDAVTQALESSLEAEASNIRRQLQRRALESSASYVLENLPLERRFDHRDQLLGFCARVAPCEGLVLEFGVYYGQSIKFLAACLPDRTIHGFDSFEGLAEPWIDFAPGLFNMDGQLPSVPENVTLIKGWFDQTLPPFLAEHPGPIALLHIDSDLYSSCRCVLEAMADRIEEGTIILFDELINYPGWERGEYRALREWLNATGAVLEPIGYVDRLSQDWHRDGSTGQQVAFRVARGPGCVEDVAGPIRMAAC